MTVTKRKMTEGKVKCRLGLAKLRTLKGVVPVRVRLAVVSVPLDKDVEVGFMEVLEARDKVMVAETESHFAVDVITDISASADVAAVFVSHVDRWDI